MSKVLHVNQNSFDEEVLKSQIPVFVDFWAEWCGPCRAIAPVLESLAEDYNGKVKIVKINVDKETDLANKYNVSAIPSLIIVKDGKEIDRIVGGATKEVYAERINKVI
ncbi:MAG: thioredoxin [Thaumarchaeota archaeon]|nr:thioredoxin [Nitrososphaerota archaeon]|tara:strand:- start:331 stop:654 length:324 start_codon:yes stop_codon:yes gene_type:complete